jgi:osmotically-inducible protein OsmY
MPRNAATATRPSRVLAYVVAYTLLVALPAAAQTGYRVDPQGKDELWDVTSKMEMPGMPMGMPGMSMAMPAQTNRICVQAGSEEAGVPKKDECRVLESKRIGNKVSYRMACRNAKDDYTATGESTWSGSGYQGRMQMVGKMQGEQMEMTMAYTGMRAGNCTSTTR